jgi:phage baseplate assembly protein V
MSAMGIVRRVLRHLFDSSTPTNQVQIESLADDVHNDVEVAEPYGFTAYPPEDVPEGIAVFPSGESDHGIVIGWFDKKWRPKTLLAGEVMLYSRRGHRVHLKDNGSMLLTDQQGSVIEFSTNGDIRMVPASGKLQVTGDVLATGDVKAGVISLQGHKHSGVIPGGGISGLPQ